MSKAVGKVSDFSMLDIDISNVLAHVAKVFLCALDSIRRDFLTQSAKHFLVLKADNLIF